MREAPLGGVRSKWRDAAPLTSAPVTRRAGKMPEGAGATAFDCATWCTRCMAHEVLLIALLAVVSAVLGFLFRNRTVADVSCDR